MAGRFAEASTDGLPERGEPVHPLITAVPLARRIIGRVTRLGWPFVLQLFTAGLWLGLSTWKLTRVPGMSMDEAWSIISASGEWGWANPLSGMSTYTAPFQVILLDVFGRSSPLLVMRGAGTVANGIMLVLIALMLRRMYRADALVGWALPLLATCPLWLLAQRTGIEVTMFTAPLCVAGLYLFTRGPGWWAFSGGVALGLLVYNHALGGYAVAALGTAWLVVYRRQLPIDWKPALLGFFLGVLPRLLALALYDSEQITGLVQSQSFERALADLRWYPELLWKTLSGETVYLRHVGRVAIEIWPYWLLGLVMVVPFVTSWRAVPRRVWFILVAIMAFGIFSTLGAPYLAVRFFVLPVVGVHVLVVLLGAAAIELNARWRHLVRGAAGLLVLGNIYFLFNNFYLPWHRHELGITSFFFGVRSPRMGSWIYLPKDELLREVQQLTPPPEQLISNASLARPLRAMLLGTGIRVVTPEDVDRKLRSVYVDYRFRRPRSRHCVSTPGGRMCFSKPSIIDKHFVLYRR
jgi:hypothetical protein